MNDAPEPTPVDSDAVLHDDPQKFELEVREVGCPFGCTNVIHVLVVGFFLLALGLGWVTPWLGVTLLAVYFAGVWLIRRTIRRMFQAPFAMKARALEGATSEVHAVERLDQPPPDADVYEHEEGVDALAFYRIETTITPKGTRAGFVSWEPGELCLIDSDTAIRSLDDLEGEHQVFDVSIEQDGAFVEDEGFKLEGPQRLQFTVGLPAGLRRAQFLYYTQTFGSVELSQD